VRLKLMTDAVHEHGRDRRNMNFGMAGALQLEPAQPRSLPVALGRPSWLSTHLGWVFMGKLRPRTMGTRATSRSVDGRPDGGAARPEAGVRQSFNVYDGMGYPCPMSFYATNYNHRTTRFYGRNDRERVAAWCGGKNCSRSPAMAAGDKVRRGLAHQFGELSGKQAKCASRRARKRTLLGEIPDLWDVQMDSSRPDSRPVRYFSPAGQSRAPSSISLLKQLTKTEKT